MIRTGLFLASAATALALSSATARADDAELTVFDWAGFGLPEFYQPYVDKYGDKPTFAFFGDDDEAFQKLTTGFKVDLTRPCSQMVGKYRDAGLIEPWDTAKIPAFASMNPGFTASPVIKDDAGLWFLPTDYGYTAVGYNTKEVPAEDVASLDVFRNPKYAGRIALPDNTDDVWSLALLATGVTDWTNVTEEQFAAAADLIIQVQRLQGGPRKMTHVTEVVGMEQDTVVMQDVFLFHQDGVDENGKAHGHFEATGVRPAFMSRMEQAGVRLPSNLFSHRVLGR